MLEGFVMPKFEIAQAVKPVQDPFANDNSPKLQAPQALHFPKPTKKEQAEAAEAAAVDISGKAANAAIELFKNDPTFQNSSFRNKKLYIDKYLETLPDFYANNPLYANNATLQTRTTNAIKTALNSYYDTEYKNAYTLKNEAAAFGHGVMNTAKSYFDAPGEAKDLYDFANTPEGKEFNNLVAQRKTLAEAVVKRESDANDVIRMLEQSNRPDAAAQIANIRKALADQRAIDTKELDALGDKLHATRSARTRAELLAGRELSKTEQERATWNEEAIKNNPVLLDQARESYENSIVSDAENTLQGLGITDSKKPGQRVLSLLAEQTPNMAMSLGLAGAGRAAGTLVGAGIGGFVTKTPQGVAAGGQTGGTIGQVAGATLAGYIQGLTQTGQETFNAVLAMPDEDLAKSSDYQELFNQARADGLSESEAKEHAKFRLAVSAVADAAPKSALVTAVLNNFGPEFLVTKSGLINRILKDTGGNWLTRNAVKLISAGAEEGLDNLQQTVLSNIAQQKQGLPVDTWENAGESALQGVEAGLLIGAGTNTAGGIRDIFSTDSSAAPQGTQGTQRTVNSQATGTSGQTPNAAATAQAGQTPTQQAGQTTTQQTGTQAGTQAGQTATQQTTTQAGAQQATAQTGSQTTGTTTTGTTLNAQGTNSSIQNGPSTVDDIRAATLSTDNPFYNPATAAKNRQELEASGVLQNMADIAVRAQDVVNRTAQGQTPELTPDDYIALYNGITQLTATGEAGARYAKEYLDRLNSATGNKLDLTIDNIKDRATTALAQQAQTAGTQGATNGTNQGTNQGAAATGQQATATQSTANAPAGQQNPQGNTGSGTPAQGTRAGRSTRQNTTATTSNVPPNQTQTQQGNGTNSGRNNTANGTTGPQSDTGTGSTTRTPKQRTGNGRRRKVNGTTQQTGPNVDLTANPGRYTDEEYNQEMDRAHKILTSFFGDENEYVVNMFTQLWMRMSTTIANIANVSVVRALPLGNISSDLRMAADGRHSAALAYDDLGHIIHLSDSQISLAFKPEDILNSDDQNIATLAHEFMHAFRLAVLRQGSRIEAEAQNGNQAAIKFIEDFKNLAIALGVSKKDIGRYGLFSDYSWRNISRAVRAGNQTRTERLGNERMSIAFEFYVCTGKLPENSEFTKAIEANKDILDTIRQSFSEYLNFIVAYFNEVGRFFAQSGRNIFKKDGTINTNKVTVSRNILTYRVTRFNFAVAGLPKAVTNFFDNVIADGYTANIDDDMRGTISSAAEADVAATELCGQYLQDGADLAEASMKADYRVQRATEMENKLPSEVHDTVIGDTVDTINSGFANNPTLTVDSTTGNSNSDYTTAELTTDTDLYDIIHGQLDPAILADNDANNPLSEVSDHNTNGSHIYAVPNAEDAFMDVEYVASEIETNINDGSIGDPTPLNEREWFSEWANGNLIVDSEGNPQILYRTGNVMRTVPTGAELEVQTFGRSANTITQESDFANAVKTNKEQLTKLYKKLEAAAKTGDFSKVKLAKKEITAMRRAGFDAFKLNVNGEDVYFIPDLNNSADYYAGTRVGPDPTDASNMSDEQFKAYQQTVPESESPEPETEQETLDELAAMINQIQARNTQAAQEAKAARTLAHAETYKTAMTGPQRANWWMQLATRARKVFVDANAAFRLWVIENFTPDIGALDSAPLYQAYTMARNRVRGARNELQGKILRPLNQWVALIADRRSEDPKVVASDLGSLYTAMHTLEAAKRQEEELQNAIIQAQLDFSADRQKLIDEAQSNLDKYYERQSGVENGYPIYGGVTVDQAQETMRTMIEKYGDDIAEQAVGRFQRAYGDIVQLLIERGVLAEKDVMNFGKWAYYCPLVTTTEYTSTVVNDVISLFPSKLNYHRGGSVNPAVDAFTALEYLVRRSANALGSVDLGRETIASYRLLEDQYKAAATEIGPDGKPFINRNGTYAGITQSIYNENGGLQVAYYNGLGVISVRQLQQLANSDDTATRKAAEYYLQNSDLFVRVQEARAAKDENGNDIQVNESVPYVVLFDPNNTDLAETKKAFADPFHIDLKKANDSSLLGWFGKKMTKATSAFAQLNTTYRPFFPPINAWRDMVERLFYTTGKTYRDENGNEVRGDVIARGMTLNMKHTATIMKAIATGKPEEIGGHVGELLSEFKRQGIMSSASLRAMLNHSADNTYVFIEQAINDLEHGASLKDTLDKLARAGKAPFRVWAEMCYAVPTFTMYMSLRDNGVSENSAAFYTTELMNLAQRGEVTQKCATFFPFLSSIGQTSAQLTNFFGLNVGTFSGRKLTPSQVKNLARAYTLTGMTTAITAMIIPAIATGLGDGDDEEGYRILDNMSLSSFTALPIPLGDGEYIRLQLGFGPTPFAVQAAIGLDRLARGVDSFGNVAFQLADSFYRNITPIAGPEYEAKDASDFMVKLAQTITPSIIAPAFDAFVFNKNYFGQTINRFEYMQDMERKSDIDRDTTESFYKEVAKTLYDMPLIGFDASPESIKAFVKGYTPGPLAGLREWAIQDPLVKDPEFKSVADELGPALTALGASMGYGAVGNTEQHLYYAYKDFYNDALKRAGIGKALTMTDADKAVYAGAADKRRAVLNSAGFDQRFVDDYINLFNLENKLKNTTTKYKKAIQSAYDHGLDANAVQALFDSMRMERTAAIRNTMPLINLYNGQLQKPDVELPDRSILDMYRGK